MNTIFMNFENSRTSDSQRLLPNLTDKIDLEKKINILLYQTLAFTIHAKIKKNHIRTINSKYQLKHGMNILKYLMDHTLYQILKIILNIY